ncbi:flagellar basal-body MS-ring/collar protein FliF [Planctomicrobium sp.]|jgi:flagellar M-ring protein FliF|nr:flagellar basal-body MS-ring/collar protein FliF [Planctomicrobium sp.]MDB4733513.1 flagellar basal-body MS-ring/collar protein FliF [Planctomicrobium sp.]
MSFLTELSTQLKAIWNRWSQTQRISIVLAIVVSVGSVVGIGYWAMQPQYVVLADHLAPTQTSEYASALESSGIGYKLNFAGSSISVSHSEHSQARLAVRDLIGAETNTESEVTGSLWSDPAMNQVRLLRQQELRLGRTIQQMKPVREATVHITRPESSPFIRDQKPAKASVTIELLSGVPFSGSDSKAIVSLLSHSVENLTPDHVTVLSTDGRVLSSPNGMEGEVSGQLEYRTMLESNLASKAETLLIPLLGLGNATVRVSAEIDFTQTERKQTKIDTESKGKLKEESHKVTYSGNNPVALGPPGTASNVNIPPASEKQQDGLHKSEDLTTEYINGETTDVIKELPGKILRLTVAAVVQLPTENPTEESTNSSAVADGGDAQATTANSVISKQQIESIIRNAVGFDDLRGDQIEVVAATLAATPEIAAPVGMLPFVNNYLPLVKAISLGVAALVALLLGTMVIRRMRPVVVGNSSEETLSPEMIERLNDLSSQMQENPEVVTTVLASWLKSNPESGAERRKAA